MNGIDKIIGRISEDAQAEIDQILSTAKAKASEITARYEQQATNLRKETLARGERAAQERAERLAGVAELEERKTILAEKQNVLNQAFDRAHEKMANLPNQEYAALLGTLAAQAAATGKEKILLSASDREKVGEQVVADANARLKQKGLPQELTLGSETRELGGGLILSDGDIEVNCSFETLLRLSRGTIAGEVAGVLFGK